MRIVCLGTTGFHPNADRHTACYLIPEVGVVLDAGTGLFRLADHLETEHVDVFLSHAHLDHVVGLTYLIEPFGKHSFVLQGTPADLESGNEKHVIDMLVEQYKHFNPDLKFSRREKLIRSLARQQSIKTGVRLTEREMRNLVRDLFASPQANSTPEGGASYLELRQEQLEKMFGR